MSKIFSGNPGVEHVDTRCFDDFCLGSELFRHNAPLEITPKALAVLRALVNRPGELVTKQELWELVWPRVIVTDAALTMCMTEIRRVLGDDARQPRYIATVPKRGYRFIFPVVKRGGLAAGGSRPDPFLAPERTRLLGRQAEVQALREAASAAARGTHQLALVVGEPGIGKTALLAAFKRELHENSTFFVISGQCYEHFGPSEPYLPLLEGIGQICRTEAGGPVRECLDRHAPLWLTQMPSLISPTEAATLNQRILRATPERMQRELTEAMEALASDTPVALCLEDIHWSDQATLDWLNHVTRRQSAARVLVIATVRDAQALRGSHPLREILPALCALPQCREISLSRFSEDSVRQYLEQRLNSSSLAGSASHIEELSRLLHARTNGNPLYLANVVDEVLGRPSGECSANELGATLEQLRKMTIPESLLQLIGMQFAKLSADQLALLEAGSVAGESFSTALLAVAVESVEEECERWCEDLARETGLIRRAGLAEWPDGTVASRYTFKHSLYREALYARAPAGRAARLHRIVGERLERAFGERAWLLASELAMHFGRGHLHGAAAEYSLAAGRNALARAAYADAETHFRHGLEQLASDTRDSFERARLLELDLQMALGQTLLAVRGWASTAAEQAFARAYHLSGAGDNAERFMPLWGMAMVAVVRADFARYDTLGRQLMAHTTASADPLQIACAHWIFGQRFFHVGKFRDAVAEFEQALEGMDGIAHADQINLLGTHFGIFTLSYLSHAWWCLGRLDRAVAASRSALNLAQEINHHYSASLAHAYAALLHVLMGDAREAGHRASAVIDLCREQGFEYYLGWGQFIHGWTRLTTDGAGEWTDGMQQGLDLMEKSGAHLRRPYHFALLAERRLTQGRVEAGREALDAAFDGLARTHERCWEAELYRVRGVLAESEAGDSGAAEEYYRRAIATARRQDALSFELRAALPLARLLGRTARGTEARELLSGICRRFEEGPDHAALREAHLAVETFR